MQEEHVEVSSYLFFNGNGQEALHYYQEMFSATIIYEGIFKDTPVDVPEHWKEKLFHAAMKIGNSSMIMLSDIENPDNPVVFGNHSAISIRLKESTKVEEIFDRLIRDGGKLISPLEKQFFGTHLGIVQDKFGVTWILSYRPSEAS